MYEAKSFPVRPFPARSRVTGEPVTVFGVDDSKSPHQWLAATERDNGLVILHLGNGQVDAEADEGDVHPWGSDHGDERPS